MKALSLFCLLVFVGISCSSDSTNTQVHEAYETHKAQFSKPGNKATEIVKRSIDYVGGWEAYTSLRGMEYEKTLHKVDSTGAVYDKVVQQHRYNVFPGFSVRMDWTEKETDDYIIMNNSSQSWKFKHGKELTDQKNINSAYNSSHGSYYVLYQPWKLLDPGVKLTYVGRDTLPNGKICDSVQADFTEGFSTTTDHTWWYYFEDDGKPIGNFLKSPQGYSYTEYLEFEEVDGILFHVKRNTYRSDSTRTDLVLRTIYENRDIKLVPSFKASMFTK